jgi:transposase
VSGIRRVFPEAFRREAIDRVAGSGLSACAVARDLGLPETVLRRWMVSDLAAEIARLRHENDRLRMERDILKKSSSSSERPPDESRDGR